MSWWFSNIIVNICRKILNCLSSMHLLLHCTQHASLLYQLTDDKQLNTQFITLFLHLKIVLWSGTICTPESNGNSFFEFSFFTILLPLLVYLSHYLMISCDLLSFHFFVLDFTCVSNVVYPSRRIHSPLEHHKERKCKLSWHLSSRFCSI